MTSSPRWPATALVTPGPATRQCCGSAADCTHPSTLGHDQLRRLFYFHVTGEMLP